MVNYLAAAEFFHVLFAMMWVGTSIYTEAVLMPQWYQAKTRGDMRVWLGILRRTGPFQGVSGGLTLITGVVYMFLLFGTDLGAIWALPSGRLVLTSLLLILVALAISFAVVMPSSRRLGMSLTAPESDAPIPSESKAVLARLHMGLRGLTSVVVFVLVLMVVAAWGGF